MNIDYFPVGIGIITGKTAAVAMIFLFLHVSFDEDIQRYGQITANADVSSTKKGEGSGITKEPQERDFCPIRGFAIRDTCDHGHVIYTGVMV